MSTETTLKSNEEFFTEVLKAALDFNSQIVSKATVEIAGDPSARNRTRQRKVLGDIQTLGNQYNYTLNRMFEAREKELKGEDVGSEFDEETRIAIRKTIAVLDLKMNAAPNQELANATNFLELMLQNDAVEKKEEK